VEANTKPRRWTYEEFARLPESGTTRYEVIAGELVMTPGPWIRHQRIAGELHARLFSFVKSNRLGEVFFAPLDVLFGEGDYLEPDLFFVRADHSKMIKKRWVDGPPDLVIEILSPSTAVRDRGLKLERYRHFGVAEYWVVDPDARAIEVWHFARGATAPVPLGVAATLHWQPVEGGPILDVPVAEVFGESSEDVVP
jgi:Uma2 family endonuclease